MPSLLNITNSYLEESRKKCVLKLNILQNSLKNIHEAVLNLIKFLAKCQKLDQKETPGYVLSYRTTDRLLL